MKFKKGDKVKTVVCPYNKEVARSGVIVYVHKKEKYVPYIVDFGDTWAGFSEKQLKIILS